jgi:hypothetical protein
MPCRLVNTLSLSKQPTVFTSSVARWVRGEYGKVQDKVTIYPTDLRRYWKITLDLQRII